MDAEMALAEYEALIQRARETVEYDDSGMNRAVLRHALILMIATPRESMDSPPTCVTNLHDGGTNGCSVTHYAPRQGAVKQDRCRFDMV